MLNKEEMQEAVEKHLNGIDIKEFGVWVYYPWRNIVVHLLGEHEFAEVKTNRNRNKITIEEQQILTRKKIGVIGLSVGQSVATTIAMEKIVGTMRLADFDKLDLSNCNRIRTGVFNINVSKVILTAREIAELDPFIKVECFSNGINENNIDEFIGTNNQDKLDVIIEECDSIDIKVLARMKAKQNNIPLVMEMSDRGMIDIERYDLEPEYEMFHGKVAHLDLDLSVLQKLNPAEKVQYLYPMVGGDSVSAKLLASAAEVGKSLLTWPQLASAVVLGGGVCADVVRRILLNQFKKSGRYYVDLETLIA